MNTSEYLEKVKKHPETLAFSELMGVIDLEYDYTPAAFTNGSLSNAESENAGSCKLFSFAKLHGLSVDETLSCFGSYYRDDVLKNPEASDHQNIRNFMKTGWEGIQFDQVALIAKA